VLLKKVLIFPDTFTEIGGAPRVVPGNLWWAEADPMHLQVGCGMSPGIPNAPLVVPWPPILLQKWLPSPPGAPEGHSLGTVKSEIWPIWDSGLTTPKHSQRLQVAKIHFVDTGAPEWMDYQCPMFAHLSRMLCIDRRIEGWMKLTDSELN